MTSAAGLWAGAARVKRTIFNEIIAHLDLLMAILAVAAAHIGERQIARQAHEGATHHTLLGLTSEFKNINYDV